MKKLLLLGLYWLVTVSALAITTPEKINYQGVARSADGTLLVNQNLGIQIQIRTVNSNGEVVYSETHTVITNQYGLFSLQIGDGSVELGAFTDINWNEDTFVELSMDFNGGTNYISMGTSQLVAVPYALHAKTADNVFSGSFGDLTNAPVNVSDFANDAGYITSANDADADATNEIQDLALVGSTLTITNNASATAIDLSSIAGADTDSQTLNLTGTDLDISGGNTVDLSGLQDGFEANTDAQNLTLTGTELSISNGNLIDLVGLQDGFEANTDTQLSEAEVDAIVANNGYISAEVDGDVTNEIQDLSLVGSTLKITNNATATEINLAPFSGTNTDEQTLSLVGTDLSITNGNLVDLSSLKDGVDDADADATNEIQQISLIGSTLEISDDASTVDLSSFYDNTDAQTLSLVGTEVSILGGNTIDVASLQDGFEANTDAQTLSLSGNDLTIAGGNTVALPASAGGAFSTATNVTSNTIGTQAADDFVFGSPQLADDGLSTHDRRFFFDKSKGAFRAGYAPSVTWDDANVGWSSFATGRNTTASGNYSTAMGNGTDASGDYSTAMGQSTASGDYSTAMGKNTTASGNYSIAMGKNTTAQAQSSLAIGYYNLVSGTTDSEVANDPLFVIGNGTFASRSNALTVLKNGNMGIGVTDPDTDLEIAGQIKITGGTPGNGKVLTSDANGLASWITPAAGGGTDDQIVDVFTLSGTTLNLSLENDGQATKTVNLSSLQDGFEANTDNQVADVFTLSGTTLNLSLSGDGQATKTVNLASLQDGTGTDNQSLSISGNNVTISGGNTITIPSGGAGTDDQVVDLFSLSGTTLNLSLESDGQATKTVNLSSLQDGFEANTDTQLNEIQVDAFVANNGYLSSEIDGSTTNELQTLSLVGTNLTISSKNTVDLVTLQDGTGTDNQVADVFSLTGNTLNLSLSGDGQATKTVDLSSLGGGGGTDDQTVDLFTLSGTTLNLSLESDGQATKTVNLSSLQDGFEANTDNQVADVFSLTGSTLNLSLSGDGQVTKTVDLSSLGGGGGTDDQTVDVFTLTGTTLNLSLESDGEVTKTADLSSLQDGTGTDDQKVDVFSLLGNNTLVLSLENDGELNKSVDLSGIGVQELNDLSDVKTNTSNLFLGVDAGANQAGVFNENIGIGRSALNALTSGADNIAIGSNTLKSATTSANNIAIGTGALKDITVSHNIGIGAGALGATTTGFSNVALGTYAGLWNTTGGSNVTIGHESNNHNYGSRNTIIGALAGKNVASSSRSDCVFLGYNVGANSTLNNRLMIDNSSTATPLIYGEFDNNILKVNGTLKITEVMNLKPLASAPSGVIGDLYVSTSGKLYFHNGSTWKEVSLL